MTSATPYGNPFVVTPPNLASGVFRSGGGGDGAIDHLVGLVLQRVNPRPTTGVSDQVPAPGLRGFDLAELIAWAGAAAGVSPRLPDRTDLLRAACYRARSSLRTVDVGIGLKGALLFGGGSVGLSLGQRRRVVVYDTTAGIVIDTGMRGWTEAARVPGARGYR